MTPRPHISIDQTIIPDDARRLGQLKSIAATTLSCDEATRVRRLRVSGAADAFIVGRLLARQRLAEVIGCSPADVAISIDRFGRPSVEGTPLSFNLSHSGRHVVLAVASIPVGIDCQLPDPDLEAGFEETFATQREQWDISSPESVYTLWTRKEAVLKCLGTGFHTDPRSIELGDRSAVAVAHPDCSTWTISVRSLQWNHEGRLAVAWRRLPETPQPMITRTVIDLCNDCHRVSNVERLHAQY
jgi:4'-phosphopantetheinyl transferase